MPKLKLDLDSVQVDTFATGPEGAEAGTVQGFRIHTVTGYPLSCWQSCWPEDTCPGCTDTCAANTCGDTCTCGGGGTGDLDCGPDNTVVTTP